MCLLGHRIIPWLLDHRIREALPVISIQFPDLIFPEKTYPDCATVHQSPDGETWDQYSLVLLNARTASFLFFIAASNAQVIVVFPLPLCGAASTIPLCNIVLSSLCHRQHTDIYGVLSLHQMIGSHGFALLTCTCMISVCIFPAASSVI